MKTLKIVLLSSLLALSANAMTAKVTEESNESNKKVYSVLKSEKKDHCMKPGLAVDLNYTSEHVEVDETSNVNIVVKTHLTEGILKVNIKSLDEDKLVFEEKNLEFQLSKEKENHFPVDLELVSSVNGKHFLTVFITSEGKGGRVFEVPVSFGEVVEEVKMNKVEKTKSGVDITVTKAEEEIK